MEVNTSGFDPIDLDLIPKSDFKTITKKNLSKILCQKNKCKMVFRQMNARLEDFDNTVQTQTKQLEKMNVTDSKVTDPEGPKKRQPLHLNRKLLLSLQATIAVQN